MEKGKLNLRVPLPVGARVTVFVIEEMKMIERFTDSFDDLLAASQSSLGFWDNPFDDEDWNNAQAGRYCAHPNSIH